MTAERTGPDFEAVLDAYCAEASSPAWSTLKKWMDRYPQYAHRLADYAAAWAYIAALTGPEEPIDDDEVTAIARVAARQAIARVERSEHLDLDTSLTQIARERGKTFDALAKATGLGFELLRKLDLRLIKPQSVPRVIIERLARELDVTTQAVRQYLALPPTLASGAQYLAHDTPRVAEQESFAAAVRADRSLSKEQREHLLQLVVDEDEA